MVLLTLQDVSKSFGMNCILSGVNLTLKEGARMGLVGVNGSGKSTLMKLIAGGMQPDIGTVSLMKGAQVGLLTQQADIDSDLNVWDELARVFEPLQRMEERLREMEREMAEKHADPEAMARLSEDYARLTERF